MFIFLLIGLALTAASALLVLRAFALGRVGAEQTLARIGEYGFREREVPKGASPRPLTGQLDALAGAVGNILSRRVDRFGEADLREHLQAAGMYTTSPRKFMGYRLILAVTLPVLWLWLSANGQSSTLRVVFGFLVAVVVGWHVYEHHGPRVRDDEISQVRA